MTEAPEVRHHVVVAGTPERAFAAFTERLGDFKPPEHNLLGSPIAETVFEPRVGGHIVDRARTAASAGGRGCWPSSRPTDWCSAGTSARPGSSRTPTTPARSRSGSSPTARTAPGSSSSTGTSTGTVPAGRLCTQAWTATRAGRSTSSRYAALLDADSSVR